MKTIIVVIMLAVAGIADTAPTMTEVERMKLQLAQKDAIIAQQNLQQAQTNFQKAIADFNSVCADIKKAEHYNPSATCNINNATIDEPASAKSAKPDGK